MINFSDAGSLIVICRLLDKISLLENLRHI